MNNELRNEKIAVMQFAKTMIAKLEANNHKAHWNTVGQSYLLYRLEEELAELREALVGHDGSEEKTKAVMSECADVGNFAMMISDNVWNDSANATAERRVSP